MTKEEQARQAAIAYAEEFMRQADEVEMEQYKWHLRHPEEPYVPGGIKACFLLMRDAFMAGARWMDDHNGRMAANIAKMDEDAL